MNKSSMFIFLSSSYLLKHFDVYLYFDNFGKEKIIIWIQNYLPSSQLYPLHP